MSRIAEARRKAGVLVAADAELAWDNARAATQGTSTASANTPNVLSWAIEGATPSDAGSMGEPAVVPIDMRDAVDWRPRDGAVRDEVAMLIRRLFAPPPVGAGLRTLMFCAAQGADSSQIVRTIADRLADAEPAPRVAVVTSGNGGRPADASGSGAQTIAASPADATRRAAELAALFDVVVFDTHLTGGDPDVLALARSVEGVVLVVDENGTRRDAARTIKTMLEDVDARVLGVVLSNCTYPIPRRIYERL